MLLVASYFSPPPHGIRRHVHLAMVQGRHSDTEICKSLRITLTTHLCSIQASMNLKAHLSGKWEEAQQRKLKGLLTRSPRDQPAAA